jgi:molybdopterin converting factor subunit 1
MGYTSMHVNVRLFAVLAETVGLRTLPIELAVGATAASVRDALVEQYPRIGPLCTRIAFAINAEYATADTRLQEGDEVALIPPVSGG